MNPRSNDSASSPAPTDCANSMKRLDCSGLFGLRDTSAILPDYWAKSPLIHCGFDACPNQVNVASVVRCNSPISRKLILYEATILIVASVTLPCGIRMNVIFWLVVMQLKFSNCPSSIVDCDPCMNVVLVIDHPLSSFSETTTHDHLTSRSSNIWLLLVIENGKAYSGSVGSDAETEIVADVS